MHIPLKRRWEKAQLRLGGGKREWKGLMMRALLSEGWVQKKSWRCPLILQMREGWVAEVTGRSSPSKFGTQDRHQVSVPVLKSHESFCAVLADGCLPQPLIIHGVSDVEEEPHLVPRKGWWFIDPF